jgi:hypothetical protein
MTTEPNPALTGAAFELANAGYRAMPDPDKKQDEEPIGGDSASLRDAADRRSGPRDEGIVRRYTDQDGKPVAANEAITLERAGRDYARATTAERLVAENETSKALAARVDAMRAEALASDPDAGEFYGFEPPQVEGDKAEAENATSQTSEVDGAEAGRDARAGELDPELEKALQHAQVRQAIEQQIDEVEKTRQSYLDRIAAATQIARVSFLSQFPELASIAPEHLPGALEQMSQ